MNIEANPVPEPPCHFKNHLDGTHSGGGIGGSTRNDGDDEDDDGNVTDGPTMEAYVDLVKTAGKYHCQ